MGEATEEKCTEGEATEEDPEEDTSWRLVIVFVNPELFEVEILTPEKPEEL